MDSFIDSSMSFVVQGLLRHHSTLAKVALGAGFTYGFVYTTNHGRSPFEAMAYGEDAGGVARAGSGTRKVEPRAA